MAQRDRPSTIEPDPPAASAVAVGIDLVRISDIDASLGDFGERFLQRLFTMDEIAYAQSSIACRSERLAARFAAKEAAIKAFDLAATGVDWREIEVARGGSGVCRLLLHGRVAEIVRQRGFDAPAVSLTHTHDFAAAVVMAVRSRARGAGPGTEPPSRERPAHTNRFDTEEP